MIKKIRERVLHIAILIGLVIAEVASVLYMHERALELAKSHLDAPYELFFIIIFPIEIGILIALAYKKKYWSALYMATIIIWNIAMLVATDVSCPVCAMGG